MHILQNVPVHQHLQTRREFVIGFPESQYNGKKRKQFQLVSHIAFFQPDPMQPLAGFCQFCSLSIEFLSCIPEKVTVICQISSPHRRKAADMNPFMGGMTVFFRITQDIVNCHGFVVICIFFRLEFIHRPGDSSGDAVDPVFSSYKENIEILTVLKGRVDYFNESKGYGFIKDLGSGEKYFFHVSNNTLTDISETDIVTFELERGLRGMNAINIRIESEV